MTTCDDASDAAPSGSRGSPCRPMSAARIAHTIALALLGASASACGVRPTTSRWTCPAGWVHVAPEGCAPAVLVCGDDAGASRAECDTTPWSTTGRTDAAASDGITRESDGGFHGPWPTPGAAGGPPAMDFVPDPAPPTADWMPTVGIRNCRAGWRQTEPGVCEPSFAATCPVGAAPLPDGSCTRTSGDGCPTDEFATLPPEAAGAQVLYVAPRGRGTMGDGSLAMPFGTIGAAVAVATMDAWILVAAGRYDESVAAVRNVHIVGVCPSTVIVVGAISTFTFDSSGGLLDIRNVEIRGPAGGVAARPPGRVRMQSVRIVQASLNAVVASGAGATIELTDVWIDRTDAPIGRGVALYSYAGGRIVATRAALTENREMGVQVTGAGSRVEIVDSVVARTRRRADGGLGRAIFVERGGRLELTGSVVEDHYEAGILVLGMQSIAVVRQSAVRRTMSLTTGDNGFGVAAFDGARIEVSDTLADRNAIAGILASGAGATADVADVVVRATTTVHDSPHSAGVLALSGGAVMARGVRAEDIVGSGVGSEGAGSHLVVRDALLRGNHSISGFAGTGVTVTTGALATIERARMVDNERSNAGVIGDDSVLEITGSFAGPVRDASGRVPSGLIAAQRGRLVLRSVRVRDFIGAAIGVVDDGSTLDVDGAVVTGTGAALPGEGRCFSIEHGARATLRHVVVDATVGPAILAQDEGTDARVEDSVLARGRFSERNDNAAAVLALGGAHVAVNRVLALENESVAFIAGLGASVIQLEDSVVIGPVATPSLRYGGGMRAQSGGSVTVTRTLVQRTHALALVAADPDSQLDVRDSLIVDCGPTSAVDYGRAIVAGVGARVSATSTVVVGATEVAIQSVGMGSRLTLDDVIVVDTRASRLGYAHGLLALDGATVTVHRAAFLGTLGAAIFVAPDSVGRGSLSRLDFTDLYVADVRSASVGGHGPGTSDPTLALGIGAGVGCVIEGVRAVVSGGGLGVGSTAATVRIRDVAISRQLDGVGARDDSPMAATLELTNLSMADNANDTIVSRSDLPPSAALAAPTGVCLMTECR